MLVSTNPFALAFGRMLAVLSIVALVPAFASSARAETPPPQGVVNINTASPDELMLLPRIGEGKAHRIVEFRQKTPFKTVNELARVKGIGLKTLRLLKPYIRVDGPTTLASEVRAVAGDNDEALSAPEPKSSPKGATPGGTTPK
ncbi:MAG: ComEA family DNA-binding protein [Myxococcota bacterium]